MPPGQSGENIFGFKITNGGATGCSIQGYPAISLLDQAGSVLPFHYVDGPATAVPAYVTSALPRPVYLDSGGFALFVVAKYRCDVGHSSVTSTMRVSLPGQLPATVSDLRDPRESFPLCTGEGAADPGLTIQISPIEATMAATGAK